MKIRNKPSINSKVILGKTGVSDNGVESTGTSPAQPRIAIMVVRRTLSGKLTKAVLGCPADSV